MRPFVVSVLLAVAGPLTAQEMPRLDARLLPQSPETLAVYLLRGRDTIRTGTLVDELRISGNRITRIYAEDDQISPQLDTIVSSVPELKPVSFNSRSSQMIARIAFSASTAQGWIRTAGGDSIAVRVPLPEVVYDGASFDLIVRASPLRDGYALTVPIFMAGANSVGTVGGRVRGSQAIAGRDCWVFAATFGAMSVTFWIDKETRSLRQQLLQVTVDTAILLAPPRPGVPGTRSS